MEKKKYDDDQDYDDDGDHFGDGNNLQGFDCDQDNHCDGYMRLIFQGERGGYRRQNNNDDDEDVVDDGRTWSRSKILSREGEEVSLVCISEGARPAAVLAWYNGTRWAVE